MTEESTEAAADDEEETAMRSTRAECILSCVGEAVPPLMGDAAKPLNRGAGD